MSTNWKNTNVWGIPSMETYLTSIIIRKKYFLKRIRSWELNQTGF
jgi:hypothetical protein